MNMFSKRIAAKGSLAAVSMLAVGVMFGGAASACSSNGYDESHEWADSSHTSQVKNWSDEKWEDNSWQSHEDWSPSGDWSAEEGWSDEHSSEDHSWNDRETNHWGDADRASYNSGHESDWSAGHDNGWKENGHDWSKSDWNDSENWSDSDADEEYYQSLDTALEAHAATGVETLRAAYSQDAKLPELLNQVEQNNMEISSLVDSAYPGVNDEFLQLWKDHIGYYIEYLNATAAKDENGQDEARDKLAWFSQETAHLLASNSRDLDQDRTEQAFLEHGNQVTEIIDNIVWGDEDAVMELSMHAVEHMRMTAELLAEGSSIERS